MPSHIFGQIQWGTAGTVLGLVALLAAAVFIVLSRRREDVHSTLTANVVAQKELIASLKEKLANSEADLKKANDRADRLEEENKATALEYKALASLDLAELINAGRLKRENDALREEVRQLIQTEERRKVLEEDGNSRRRMLRDENK